MEKAFVVWLPSHDKEKVVSFYSVFAFASVRDPIFPSRINCLHPSGRGHAREEMPRPYEAELVLVHRSEHADKNGKVFYVGYPYDNRRHSLPGVTESLALPAPVDNDLLVTHFMDPQRYVRIFRGKKVELARCNLKNDDLTEWSPRLLRDSSGEVKCWIDYVMACDNRLIGRAYPSIANQQTMAEAQELGLSKEVVLGHQRGEGISVLAIAVTR